MIDKQLVFNHYRWIPNWESRTPREGLTASVVVNLPIVIGSESSKSINEYERRAARFVRNVDCPQGFRLAPTLVG